MLPALEMKVKQLKTFTTPAALATQALELE
jgi:hypothetical protein